jgi:hypothetical protein
VSPPAEGVVNDSASTDYSPDQEALGDEGGSGAEGADSSSGDYDFLGE